MQHFLFTNPPESGTDAVVVRDHQAGYEFLVQTNDPSAWVAAYLVKIDDAVGAAVTCWDQQFDEVLRLLSDPEQGPIQIPSFRELWPTWFRLLDNAADGRYGDGALAEFVDPDDLNTKWFIARLVNISSHHEHEVGAPSPIVSCPNCGTKNRLRPNAEGVPKCARCKTLLQDDTRLYEAVDAVVELSFAVHQESQKELSWRQKAKIFGRGAASGHRRGTEIVGPWQERLGWLQAMVGS